VLSIDDLFSYLTTVSALPGETLEHNNCAFQMLC